MTSDQVSLTEVLHQTIVGRTRGGIRNLKVTHGVKEICVSGMARDFYHFQLVIAAVTTLLANAPYSIRFEIAVD